MELKLYDFLLDFQTFIIEEEGVRVVKKGISSRSESFIEFEYIGSTINYKNSSKLFWLLISILFFLIGILVLIDRLKGGEVGDNAELFHFVTASFFLSVFLITKKNVISLTLPDSSNAIDFIGA